MGSGISTKPGINRLTPSLTHTKGATIYVNRYTTSQASEPVIGEGMSYSNEYAASFSDKHFPGYRAKLENLYADGTIPKNYYVVDGRVYDPSGNEVSASTEYSAYRKKINVYLYKKAFASPNQLYLDLGHEYIHVNLFLAGFSSAEMVHSHDLTAYAWDAEIAKIMGLNNKEYLDRVIAAKNAKGEFYGRHYFPYPLLKYRPKTQVNLIKPLLR